jgi:hypothetical protein
MDWLRNNVFLAAWLSPVIALVGLCIQNARLDKPQIDWSRIVIYVAYLTFVAVAITPSFDASARATAGILVSAGFFWLILDAPRRRG